MLTNEERAYAAGIVDGEGYLGVNRHGDGKDGYNYQVNCTVVSSTLRLLEFLQTRWGGSVHVKPLSSFGKKPAWQWRIASIKADKFVTDIYPHLLVKKEQAKLLRTFQELVRQNKHRPRTSAYLDMQAKIHRKVKELNSDRSEDSEVVPHADRSVQEQVDESAHPDPASGLLLAQ
ncbi:MAG: hypothetical protein L0Z53_06810 [Acidobacteriales bacterium]|nr:hypothetical protein [Terriglobales bacterium]